MNIHEYEDWKHWDESLQRYHIKKALEGIWYLLRDIDSKMEDKK